MLDNWEMLLYAIIPSVRAKTTNSWPKFRLNRRITRMAYLYGHTYWANGMCLGYGGRFWSNTTIAVQQQPMCLGCQPWLVERAFEKLFPSSGQPSLTSTELAMDHFLRADQCQQFYFFTNPKQRAAFGRQRCRRLLLEWVTARSCSFLNWISVLASEGADRRRRTPLCTS